jgi:hypothetical protein
VKNNNKNHKRILRNNDPHKVRDNTKRKREKKNTHTQKRENMDEATLNKLYGWKGRVHKAIKVFKQCKVEYVRVCALPKTKGALLKTIKGTTCDHDADIALTWVLLESSRKIVDVTCDGYIASIRRSFHAYRKKQEENTLAPPPTARRTINGADVAAAPTTENSDDVISPTVTIMIEGIVENTVNSHIKFIEQWRDIISDAQKEAVVWKSEHEKYLDKMCEVKEVGKNSEDPNYVDSDDDSVDSDDSDNDSDDSDSESDGDSDDDDQNDDKDDDDDDDNDNDDGDSVNDHGKDPLELLRLGMRVDEHADRLFQMGTYISAGKVLISSLKIASKIETIETAAQEAGTACILGLTHHNLRDRDVILSNLINVTTTNGNNDDERTAGNNQSESDIFEEWKEQADTTKLNAIYSWYRMHHGTLSCVDMKHL